VLQFHPSIPHFHQYHLLPTSVAHPISVINSTTTITTTPTTTCLFKLLRHHYYYYYATHSLKEDINRITLHHESVQLPSSKLPHTTITIVPLNVLCPVFIIPTAANVYIAIQEDRNLMLFWQCVVDDVLFSCCYTTTNHHYCTTITNQPTNNQPPPPLLLYCPCLLQPLSVVCHTLSWVSYLSML
jgi:hypothetical protein